MGIEGIVQMTSIELDVCIVLCLCVYVEVCVVSRGLVYRWNVGEVCVCVFCISIVAFPRSSCARNVAS